MYIYSITSPQSGQTALQLAAAKKRAQVVETLLGAHTDVNLQEKVLGLIRVHVHTCIYCTLVHFICMYIYTCTCMCMFIRYNKYFHL